MSTASASAWLRLTFVTRARTVSPGRPRRTKTTNPFSRATPLPPKASESMWSSSSWSLATGAAIAARLPSAFAKTGCVGTRSRLSAPTRKERRALPGSPLIPVLGPLRLRSGGHRFKEKRPPRVLANERARVRPTVRRRVESLSLQEVVLDELRVRVEAQDLVVDEATPSVGRDHDRGYPQPVAVPVDDRRRDVVVEAAPVVPGEEDRRRLPVGAAHDGVDQAGHPGLALTDERGRVLADLVVRDHPRHGRQLPVLRCPIEVADRRDVPELAILAHGGKPGQRVPDARRLRVLLLRLAEDGAVVGTVGLAALEDVVAPRDVVLVQQVRQIRACIVGTRPIRLRLTWRRLRRLDRVDAAERIAPPRALGRPLGDREQVRGQTPRRVGLEHVVLKHEVARVGPVVRDLARVVVAHDVDPAAVDAARLVRIGTAGLAQDCSRLPDESVHQPVVDVVDGIEVVVGAADIAVARVVVRLDADSGLRVRRADERLAPVHRNPVGPRERPEVGVERAVLLHDDHDVLDLVDAYERYRFRSRGAVRRRAAHELRAGRGRRKAECDRDHEGWPHSWNPNRSLLSWNEESVEAELLAGASTT